jgi:putative ABC transport system permease protein
MFENIWHDLRHAARMLVKNPGFSLIAMVSIAVGVGANVGMFGVADALVLRPLPVPRPGEVVTISAITPGLGFRNSRLSYPDYADLRDQARSFDGLVAYRFVTTTVAERPNESAQRKLGMAVSANLFDAMKVRASVGRTFRPDEDDVVGRDLVAVLDHDEWTRQFGGDSQIVGRSLRIGGSVFTLIGVTEAGFSGIDAEVRPAFYVPLAALSSIDNGVAPDERARRDRSVLTVKGRLKSGITVTEVRAEVAQIASNLEKSYPATNRNRGLAVRTEFEARTAQGAGADDAPIVLALMIFALVVLLVACANVAGLLASRARERAREVALRMAIGASRVRLIQQLVTESVMLAVAGGAVGLAFGYGVIAVFQQLEFPTDIPLKLTFEFNRRVFVVGLAMAAASTVLSSLIPAWRATRADLVRSLNDQRATASPDRRLWGQTTLVCGQVALSVVLLAVSVFLYRAFQGELGRGPGYRTNEIIMMAFDPGLARYDEEHGRQFYRLLKERASAVPGVSSVALTSSVPMKTDTLDVERVAPEGFEFPAGTDNVNVLSARVDEEYFRTIDMPLVRGRAFRATDTSAAPRVAIVNETFAARYWPAQDAIGKRIRLENQNGVFAEIVGVAANAKYTWIGEGPTEFIYLPDAQSAASERTLLIRSSANPAALARPLRETIRSIDPNMPVFGVRTMEDFYVSRAVHTTNLIVGSVGGMGVMGLVLAMVGLYGLVSYTVSRRTREIGIRIAVGANPTSVLTMVVRHGLVLLVFGISMGVVASTAARRLLQAAFPSAGSIDSGSYVFVISVVVAVTMMAIYKPARRASLVDPVIALKAE